MENVRKLLIYFDSLINGVFRIFISCYLLLKGSEATDFDEIRHVFYDSMSGKKKPV